MANNKGLTLSTSSGGGVFEEAPADTHAAICVGIVDLGEQLSKIDGKLQRKVRLDWETSFALMSDGRPFLVTQQFTASLNEKAALRKLLESWRGQKWPKEGPGEEFNLRNLLGKTCLIQVVHTPKADGSGNWINVASVTPIPKNPVTKLPLIEMPKEPHNKLRFLELTHENFSAEVFDSLGDSTRTKIAETPQFKSMFPGGLWAKGNPAPLPQTPGEDVEHDEDQAPEPGDLSDVDVPF